VDTENTAVRARPRGVFIGLSTLDVVHRVKTLPASNMKATATRQDIAAGGPALNAAVTFAALGGEATLVSYIGDSAAAQVAKEDLHSCRVNLVDLAPPAFTLPVSSVVVEDLSGNRQIVSTDATTATDRPAVDVPDHALRDMLDDCDIALFDGHHHSVALPIAEHLAARTATPMILDAGRWKPGMRQLIPLMSDVVCSADFRLGTQYNKDDLLQDLLRMGVRMAAVTNGAAPVRWATDTATGTVAAEKTEVVDSLAAGDVFHGAYAFARSAGCRVPDDGLVPAHLSFATHIAALKCAHLGTRSWLTQLHPATPPATRESKR